MARVLLVGLPIVRYHQPLLGLGYLGAALLKHGHEARIYRFEGDETELNATLKGFRPDYVGVSILTAQYADARRVLSAVKKTDTRIVTVAGGPHVSAIPETTLGELPDLDFIIVGEGEEALPLLLRLHGNNEPLSRVPGLVYRDGAAIARIAPEPIRDIDALEMPWKIVNPLSYNRREVHGYTCRHRPLVSILSSRGCPYPCTFCAQKTVFGNRIRLRDPGAFVNEMEFLHRDFGIREFHFADDNFTFYPDHAGKICREILRRKLKVSFALINGVRADRLDETLLRLMKKAGCYYLAFGLETGSPRTLERYRKSLKVEKSYENIRIASRLGFITQGFFLMAPPWERAEDLDLTIRLIRKLPLDRVAVGIPIPYPGTGLHEYYRERGLLKEGEMRWENFIWGRFPFYWESLTAELAAAKVAEAMKAVYLDPVRMLKFMLKLRTIEQYRVTFAGLNEWLRHVVGKLRNVRDIREQRQANEA